MKQTPHEFHEYIKKKNILEAKLFKKKYERVAKHVSGMPKMDRHMNPFTSPYKASVFAETI
jgi:hypothetical protein